MELNTTVHGFLVTAGQDVPELGAVLWELEHERTGTKLVWLERKEENKTFLIAFQTQPWDDTGVFHILEHSVLCGSERYPVKEPFVELMKSSLNTFLNAMTFPDRTVYPVSSRNHQDLLNLMRVYLDAVFHPAIYQKPEIFYQEGWHYEFSEDGAPFYKGVVFNEMKGAFASPDTQLTGELDRRLFPDTCYRWVSGGDPEHIPELTYEQFIAAHQRLYHPSNAYIFLDGDLDIDQVLGILDGEYLSAYDREAAPGPIPTQEPVDGGTAELVYELSAEEELTGRARATQGFVVGTFRDREELTGLRVLADVLCGDNNAPLTRRLLSSGLARGVTLDLRDGTRQAVLVLQARDVREDKLEETYEVIRDELRELVKNGLDRRRILATLDNLEFQARQRDYGGMPQGLVFGLNVLESWLYGGDPGMNLSVGDLYDRLREKCDEGWFEALLERATLKNSHTCRVIMRPSHTVGQERQAGEAQRLQDARSGWSEAELALLRERQARIRAWQETPDAPEALATIPVLRLDQIPAEPEELPLARETIGGLPALYHELTTSGITYLDLYFALDDLTPERLTQLSFLCGLISRLDTDGYSLDELQREIRSRFGSLGFTVQSFEAYGRPDQCRTFLRASCSVLDGKVERAVELLEELLLRTRWNDAGKVFALLRQARAALSQQIVMNGHSYAVGRACAGVSASAAVEEHTGGVAYLKWLKELEDRFQERFPALASDLEALAGAVFTKARLTLGATAGSAAAVESAARRLSKGLPEGEYAPPAVPAVTPWGARREGIVIPADISFVGMSGPFPEAGSGAAKVMCRAASLAYLWNAVRIQGGAYGAGMVLRDAGLAAFYSFRDPNAARTLACCRKTPEFLESVGDADLTGFIIGAVAESDPLLTPRMKGAVADSRYWKGIGVEDLRRVRRELLSAKPRDVAALAASLRRAVDAGSVCVLGSQRQIDACAGQIDTVELL